MNVFSLNSLFRGYIQRELEAFPSEKMVEPSPLKFVGRPHTNQTSRVLTTF